MLLPKQMFGVAADAWCYSRRDSIPETHNRIPIILYLNIVVKFWHIYFAERGARHSLLDPNLSPKYIKFDSSFTKNSSVYLATFIPVSFG